MDEERRQPWQVCDAGRHRGERVGPHVEPGEPGKRGERGQNGIGEADVVQRQFGEVRQAGERRERRKTLGRGGIVARDECERLQRGEIRDARQVAHKTSIDRQRCERRRLPERCGCQPGVLIDAESLPHRGSEIRIVEHHALDAATERPDVALNRAPHVEHARGQSGVAGVCVEGSPEREHGGSGLRDAARSDQWRVEPASRGGRERSARRGRGETTAAHDESGSAEFDPRSTDGA